MKTLFVGDPHLRERELSTTKGLVETSSQILDGIIKVLLDDKEICNVCFLGDMQHDTPKSRRTLRETTIWKSKLAKIGNIISERKPKMIVIERDGVEEDVSGRKQPIFSALGNHDVENKMTALTNNSHYTFFDDLLFTGIIQNPKGFIFKDGGQVYYIQFNNYGEADSPIDESVLELDESIKKIKVLHDTVKVPNSPDWFKLLKEGEYYEGEKILGDCDLAICGHIHAPLPPVVVKGDGTLGNGETIFVQTGSMGRTSMSDDNMRDYGYCTVLDTTHGISVEELRIPLMSIDDYFNWKQIRLNQNKKEAMKRGEMFNLDFGSVEITHTDPRDEINALDIEDEVKENCLNAINDADVSDNQ